MAMHLNPGSISKIADRHVIAWERDYAQNIYRAVTEDNLRWEIDPTRNIGSREFITLLLTEAQRIDG